ncbi:branched-chain amino acid ABC transporter permease [Cypionkella sp.]|uniref:branched-chain amino acid ABC transporter permease n=2 Tax=Cypionkella sp. TaxID=2811411 RepID=UPI002FDDC862
MKRNLSLFAAVGVLFLLTGMFQSWNLALQILNIGVISAIMALGVNMQWGYAGLFSTGIMGSVALGGLAVVIVSSKPVPEAWAAGGPRLLLGLGFGIAVLFAAIFAHRKMKPGRARGWTLAAILIGGFFAYRAIFDPAADAIEAFNPATAGNIGGLGLPSLLAWPVGGLFAGLAAWAIGKAVLGLRSDYLAIATLGIAEIVLAVMKNEDWLARGVKNIIDLPRPWPVPYEVDLQKSAEFLKLSNDWGLDATQASTIFVKLLYLLIFTVVLLAVIFLSERALNSPWGRMMRAIRDNEVAASAMGKDVTARHLQIFVIGSVVVGIAGAMLTSMEGQLTPNSYTPLRFTFLIWVMVIVGGSGNNWGAVLGGLLLGWLWLIVENAGPVAMGYITMPMPDGLLKDHLITAAPHLRLVTLGLVLLLVLRFSPKGLIPEK